MSKIGVFDSGIGGLTVLKEIRKVLPEYDYIYLGDNARTPYGTRSSEVVYQYTLQAVKQLFDMGCELVILACNTASAEALRRIQQEDLPKISPAKRVLGVIRPCAEKIGEWTTTGHVGIMGTEGTVGSQAYVVETQNFFPGLKVTQEACPIWVPLIENSLADTKAGKEFIKMHTEILLQHDPLIDTIVLACTHYPLVKHIIEEIVTDKVKVVSQGEIVAESLKDYLHRHPEMNDSLSRFGKIEYYTTESPENFMQKSRVFLEKKINGVKKLILK